jgi:hypothetical protein
MSGHDFDALARSLATRRSRRAVLRGLAGALVAAVAGRATQEPAAAAVLCHGYGGFCTTDASCCQTEASTCHQGRCCPTARICGDGCCRNGQHCDNGACKWNHCKGYGGLCGSDAACCQTEASTCNHGRCCPTELVCGAGCCRHHEQCVGGLCVPKICKRYGALCSTDVACCQTEPSTCHQGKCCPTDLICGDRCCLHGRQCITGDICCRPERTCTAPDGAQQCCPAGRVCDASGYCACPDGLVECGDECVECCLNTDCFSGDICMFDICDQATLTCTQTPDPCCGDECCRDSCWSDTCADYDYCQCNPLDPCCADMCFARDCPGYDPCDCDDPCCGDECYAQDCPGYDACSCDGIC